MELAEQGLSSVFLTRLGDALNYGELGMAICPEIGCAVDMEQYEEDELTEVFKPDPVIPERQKADIIAHMMEQFAPEGYNTRKRDRVFVEHRFILCHLLRKYTHLSLSQIGKYVDKDHSTVIHYMHEVDNLLEYDKKFTNKITHIENTLQLWNV